MTKTLGSIAVLMAVAGCAATDATSTTTERASEREYRTGSRIPVRPGGPAVSDVRTIEREQMERAGAGDMPTSNTPGGSAGTR